MNITVILCTYNRCVSLERTLRSVSQTTVPGSFWEVLIVDNNSSDGTRQIAEYFCRTEPQHFRYLFEPTPGKSNALNSGIKEARGEILAFLDDDVVVESDWLERLTAPLGDSRWAGVGGKIVPDGEFRAPRWIPLHEKYALAPLAMFDLGSNSAELHEAPFGTNMAFRKSVFAKLGGFRVDLGPQPGSAIRSEDTEFGYRVLGDGLRLWYEPSAIVHHSLPPNRLRKPYFLTWWHDKARADLRCNGVPVEMKLMFLGIPLVFLRRLGVWTIRWLTSFNPARRFGAKLKVWAISGQIKECFRLAHESGTHNTKS